MFNNVRKKLNTLFVVLGVILLIAIVVASSIQVFTRYVLRNAMTGTEEFSRYCFIWMSVLGASIAVGEGSHASITIITDKLSGKTARVFSVLIHLLIAACGAILVIYGIRMVGITRTQRSPIMQLPMCYMYLCLPISGVGMIVNALANIIELFPNRKEGSDA